MKMKSRIVWITGVSVLLGLATAVAATVYSQSWGSVDGGGAVHSTSDAHVVDGAIGAWDGGISASGDFQVQGGFWVTFPVAPDAAARDWGDYE